MFSSNRYRFLSLLLGLVLLAGSSAAWGADKIKVVTTTQDLAALTREVGGDKVEVEAIAKGYQDPHFVDAKPSFLLLLRRAHLLEVVGLDLERGWLPPLQSQSGNPEIQVGGRGYFDASRFAEILEIPTGQVTRAMGDVHPMGNPHYWLDPQNGRRIAKGIADKLGELRPGDAAYFGQRLADFNRRLDEAEKRWDQIMAPYHGHKVVTYHRSWPNFLRRFQLVSVGEVEPRPGIPPSPSHTLQLIQLMKQQGVKVILVEPYFDLRTPKSIARATGAEVVVMLPSVGGEKGVDTYFDLFDYDLPALAKAFASQ